MENNYFLIVTTFIEYLTKNENLLCNSRPVEILLALSKAPDINGFKTKRTKPANSKQTELKRTGPSGQDTMQLITCERLMLGVRIPLAPLHMLFVGAPSCIYFLS